MMRLVDLEPQFLRYEERLDTGRPSTRQPLPGESLSSVLHHQVTEMRAYWPYANSIDDAQGIEFLCPKCFQANSGPSGTHAVVCWSRTRGVPDAAQPGPGRWLLIGTGYHDLTLEAEPCQSRSVALIGGCAWHGFVTNGEVA